MKLHKIITILCFTSALSAMANESKTVVEGISVPWGMAELPGGQALITERSGKLYRVNLADGSKTPVQGLPEIAASGQGGLLDVETHPNFKQNQFIYLSLSSPQGEGRGSNTAIVRAKLDDTSLTDLKFIYKATPNSTNGRHFGSRLEFDQQGFLYFSIGDRGDRDALPQDITTDGGKIYRLKDDGAVPDDNPFVDNKDAKPAIYSYGHRNPQGMAVHPKTGAIWTHEHGPKGGDEINIIAKGKNYGWPTITYGVNYSGTTITELTHKDGMEQPEYYWDPSIAPSGMTFVTSDRYSDWKGHLLVGSLKFGYLVLCKLDGNKVVDTQIVMKGIGRVRNVKQLSDGYIYVATDGDGIKKIIPKNP